MDSNLEAGGSSIEANLPSRTFTRTIPKQRGGISAILVTLAGCANFATLPKRSPVSGSPLGFEYTPALQPRLPACRCVWPNPASSIAAGGLASGAGKVTGGAELLNTLLTVNIE